MTEIHFFSLRALCMDSNCKSNHARLRFACVLSARTVCDASGGGGGAQLALTRVETALAVSVLMLPSALGLWSLVVTTRELFA